MKKLVEALFPTMMKEPAKKSAKYVHRTEGPDERCRYDLYNNEWRYDVAE